MNTGDESRALARGWLRAARNPAIAADLQCIYDRVAAEVESRGPACWASGRCCRFAAAGHRLYVTGLEAARTLLLARDVPRPPPTTLSPGGACPFQHRNLCAVHPHRPLGCRVYFCDRSAVDWQHRLSEAALGEIRHLHQRHAVEYRYAPWLDLLALLSGEEP